MSNRNKFWVTVLASLVFMVVIGGGWVLVLYKNNMGLGGVVGQLRALSPDFFKNIRQTVIDVGLRGAGERTGLPLIEIGLSRNDVAHFSNLHTSIKDFDFDYYSKHNQWRKAKLEFEGKKYKVKIKSHGRQPTMHKDGRYISMSVKLPKGELIRGANRFSLLVRSRLSLLIIQTLFFAKELGLITQEEEWFRVKINSWSERIFYLEHRLDNDFMESTGRASLWRLQYSTPLDNFKSLTYVYPGPHPTYPDLRTSHLTGALLDRGVKKESHAPIIERYLDFNEAILKNDSNKIIQFFDQDYMASYAALRIISGFDEHGLHRVNFFNFYNQADGLFYPAISRDNLAQELVVPSPHQSVEKQLYPSPLFSMLSQHDAFRQKKYQIIHELIVRYPLSIEPGLKEIEKAYDIHLDFGWANSAVKRFIAPNRFPFPHNLKVLQEYLSRANPRMKVRGNANTLTMVIEPHSMSAIGFDRLDIGSFEKSAGATGETKVSLTTVRGTRTSTREFPGGIFKISKDGVLSFGDVIKEMEFFDGFDRNKDVVETHYVLKIGLKGVDATGLTQDALNVGMRNRVTGEEITAVNIAVMQDEDNAYPDALPSDSGPDDLQGKPEIFTGSVPFALVQKKFPEMNISRTANNEMIIHPGVYKIMEDFVVPRDLKVVIEAGTTLLMGENVAFIGYQGVHIKGTAEAPVVIEALDPAKPYGSVGFLGSEQAESTIDYLYQSGGSDRWVNGVFFSGGLSVHYNKKVILRNSQIKRNHADDGVNFKYVDRVLIENTLFQDNFADQIDLDSSNARVIGSQFYNKQKADLNGDGIDVSGSDVLISNSIFSGFNDKGISTGERSNVIIHKSKLHNNNIGVAVKDLSHAFFVDVDFNGNAKDIAAYRKKRIFGGGYVYLESSDFDENEITLDVDRQSRLFMLDSQSSQKTLNFNPETVNLGLIFKEFKELKTHPAGVQSLDN